MKQLLFFDSLILDFLGLSFISLTHLINLLYSDYSSSAWFQLVGMPTAPSWPLSFSKQPISLGYFLCPQNLNTICILSTVLLWAVFLDLHLCTTVRDLSFWMSNRHLKLNISKTSYSIFPPNLFLPQFSLLNPILSFNLLRPEIRGYVFLSFHQ